MTNVKMKAADTLHITGVKEDNLAPGEEFEVSTSVADDLEARGLATRVGAKAKAESPPENKMEAAPANKGQRRPISAKSVPSKNTATAKRKAK